MGERSKLANIFIWNIHNNGKIILLIGLKNLNLITEIFL